MKILTGNLSEQSMKTLTALLGRAPLKGTEVQAFNQLTGELRKFKVAEVIVKPEPEKPSPTEKQPSELDSQSKT